MCYNNFDELRLEALFVESDRVAKAATALLIRCFHSVACADTARLQAVAKKK